MAVFKEFAKDDAGALVAVVDFPNARKHTPTVQNGKIVTVVTPNPHEERLTEDAFSARFKGLDFAKLRTLPWSEEGHDLKALMAQAAQPSAPSPKIVPGQEL